MDASHLHHPSSIKNFQVQRSAHKSRDRDKDKDNRRRSRRRRSRRRRRRREMQIPGLPPDIYSLFEFAFTAFLISLGFVYLLKYTDSNSNNFVQENGNFYGDVYDDDRHQHRHRRDRGDQMLAPSAPSSRDFCLVCGDWSFSRCSRCKVARYCSETCQIKHWRAGHKLECKEYRLPGNVDSTSAANSERRGSSHMSISSSEIQHSKKDGASAETIQSSKRTSNKELRNVGECPICLTAIRTYKHSRPSLTCNICKQKFHSTCLTKWFSTSKKSRCPCCQSPFKL